MKNNHIIIESSLTQVVLLYQQKNYPFIDLFKNKIKITKMLLNNDIQFFFVQMILKLAKGNKCNYVYYCNFSKSKFE